MSPTETDRQAATSLSLNAGGGVSARLALRPREAAKALGIGQRLLWSLTNRGEIPHVRLGKAILYPVEELRRYLAEQAQRNGRGR